MNRPPLTILIADANPEDRDHLRQLLLLGSQRRIQFSEVETGAALIAACTGSAAPPDCVILDYHLPDLDADAVLAALRGDRPITPCPVLVLTGSSGLETKVLQAGAQDYLDKGWLNAGILTRAVNNAVERFHLTRALREADLRKDEFLATLAHELRNPLAALRMGLLVLERTNPEHPPAQTRAMMDRQLGHLVRLVDDLLDVARISSGRLELVRRRVALPQVFAEALETLRPSLEASGHRLTVALPEAPLWLDCDVTRLVQVLSNLLHNASKYTPPSGRITLRAEERGAEVLIQVEDSGCGIAAEVLPRVFDLFTQAGGTRAQGGLGVGLSLVKRLVELHGGRVTAQSGGAGQGSTFALWLPLAAAPPASAAPEGAAAPSPAATWRILVVDDNSDAAESLAEVLEISGHETRTVADGPAALVAVRSFQPDVVFLDIGMPGMDGHEVARRLRAEPQGERLVLIALTGWGTIEDRRRSQEAGFDHHLTKPPDLAVLESLLAKLER